MDTRSDPDLLLAMSRGDESAAATLHARIGPRLTAYARALLRDDALAEDAVQQAWLRALTRSPEELRAVRDAMGWMVRMTRGLSINLIRNQSRAAARDRLRLSADTVQPADPLGDSHSRLLTAVQRLSDDHREVILLRHVAGLTFDQVAAALDENRSTITSRYRAALESLRDALPPQDASPAAPARTIAPSPRSPQETHHA